MSLPCKDKVRINSCYRMEEWYEKKMTKVVSCALFMAMVMSISMPAGCRAGEQPESGADILEKLCEQEAAEQEIAEETLEK